MERDQSTPKLETTVAVENLCVALSSDLGSTKARRIMQSSEKDVDLVPSELASEVMSRAMTSGSPGSSES